MKNSADTKYISGNNKNGRKPRLVKANDSNFKIGKAN